MLFSWTTISSSGELFHTLCAQDLYATGIIHSNIIGLP